MTAEDLWLAENTIDCKPFAARISKSACATQQKRDRFGCPCADRVTGVAPLPATRKRHPRGLDSWIRTGRKFTSAELGYDPDDDDSDDLPEAAQAPEQKPKAKGRRGRIAKRGETPFSMHYTGRKAKPQPEPEPDTAPGYNPDDDELPEAAQAPAPKAPRRSVKPALPTPTVSAEGRALHAELDRLAGLGSPAARKLAGLLSDDRRSA